MRNVRQTEMAVPNTKKRKTAVFIYQTCQLGHRGAVFPVFCIWICDQRKGYDEQQPEHGLWICFIFLHIPFICHYSYIINEWLYCQQLTTERLLSPIVQRRKKNKIEPQRSTKNRPNPLISQCQKPVISLYWMKSTHISDLEYSLELSHTMLLHRARGELAPQLSLVSWQYYLTARTLLDKN